MAQQKLELTWYGKEKEIKVESRLLIENPSLSYSKARGDLFDNSKFNNMLIHGDNLIALKSLEKDYTNKIKCIYIDPPYNTGSAFEHYDDNIEHSIWLNLMRERLRIMRNLISENGFIAVHIDDSEGHYLKILLDEVFGRDNYLTTFYVRVRYSKKTLKQDMVFHKEIEQVHLYRKKYGAIPNLQEEQIGFDKFNFYVSEINQGKTISLGNKKVDVFQKGDYTIEKKVGSENGRKEIWASGTILDGNSSGRFFRDYLGGRTEEDGLGVLYKVWGIGDDKFDYRYFTGPNKKDATKGKYYQGVPKGNIGTGSVMKKTAINNFYDFASSFGNCRQEGGVEFRSGKIPEILLELILKHFSSPGDIVLDSFLGSGTTIAVAHKMQRRWIGIEMNDQVYSHCKIRLDSIINNKDKTGISKTHNWNGGGGYKFYELAPSLIKLDEFGQEVINTDYNSDMLASAIALHEGYKYEPSQMQFWKQAHNGESSYLFTTTKHIDRAYIDAIHAQMIEGEFLIISCKSFESNIQHLYKSISIKKIPQSLLKNCEFGVDNYDLNIINPPVYEEDDEDE